MSNKDPRTRNSSQSNKSITTDRRDVELSFLKKACEQFPVLSSPNPNEQGGKRGRTTSDQDIEAQTKSSNSSKRSKSIQRRSRTNKNNNSPIVATTTIEENKECTGLDNASIQTDINARDVGIGSENCIPGREVKFDITHNAVTFATNQNLPILKFSCEPKVKDQKIGASVIKGLFDQIKKDFKQRYPKHNDVIGFEAWFTDVKGDICGITRDIELFTFLCDPVNVPRKLANIDIRPILPKHLPPQRSVILKGVPNSLNVDDLKMEIITRFKSMYAIEELTGTNNGKSRYVRIDLMDSHEYKQLLNAGVLCVEGQCLHVYEYLAPPKILFCSKCNDPGHHRKICKLAYERCRKCGEDKSIGEHDECSIRCHNCNEKHVATDFKCPVVQEYRRDLMQHLQLHPELLPEDVQMFVPLHYRKQGMKTLMNRQFYSQQPTKNATNQLNNGNDDQWPCLPSATRNTIFSTKSANPNCTTSTSEIQLHINKIEKECVQAMNEYEKRNLEIKTRMYSCVIQFQSILSAITTIMQRQNDIISALKTSINDCLQMNKFTNQCIISMLTKPNDQQLKTDLINQLTDIPIQERQAAMDNLFSTYYPLMQELTVKVMEVSSHLLNQNEQ